MKTASTVLMIRPHTFGVNPQTAASNAFQSAAADENVSHQALIEFEGAADALKHAGVNVIVMDDVAEPPTPDAIFPNNWLSFHADGRVVLYPMAAPNRRAERRLDVLRSLEKEFGFSISQIVDWSAYEDEEMFLEGTGSLVLDRNKKIAYACRSTRTHDQLLEIFADEFDYHLVPFSAHDRDRQAIYHTNVMMSVGDNFAVVCQESIDEIDKPYVIAALRDSGKVIIEIDYQQLYAFVGNCLQLATTDGSRIIALSSQAKAALRADQIKALSEHGRLVDAPLDTIERVGGGSMRCMLARIFLPKRSSS
ncbi:MAG: amidinotransferase [Gammaproteobacteria bacterium]|nr:amidinotransferase [Gammaproteobacteria bacterium]